MQSQHLVGRAGADAVTPNFPVYIKEQITHIRDTLHCAYQGEEVGYRIAPLYLTEILLIAKTPLAERSGQHIFETAIRPPGVFERVKTHSGGNLLGTTMINLRKNLVGIPASLDFNDRINFELNLVNESNLLYVFA